MSRASPGSLQLCILRVQPAAPSAQAGQTLQQAGPVPVGPLGLPPGTCPAPHTGLMETWALWLQILGLSAEGAAVAETVVVLAENHSSPWSTLVPSSCCCSQAEYQSAFAA